MLVRKQDLEQVVSKFSEPGRYGLDTETTGLRPWNGDRLFSLILSDESEAYYFNFQTYADLDPQWILDKEETLAALAPVWKNKAASWYAHNAKFDMAMLDQEGVTLWGEVVDTEVLGRLLFNRRMKYSLDVLAEEYLGEKKSQEVEDYIKTNRLYSWLQAPGKKKKAKHPHYDRVPYPIISRYGLKDGVLVRALGERLGEGLVEQGESIPGGRLGTLVQTEVRLTKTCFSTEKIGIKIDRDYCLKARQVELDTCDRVAAEFESKTGIPFKDSNKVLATAFDALGEAYPKTKHGNPSFTDDVLAGFSSPLAQLVQEYRGAAKKAGTYYSNFLYFADSNDRIHPNVRQAGTDTGRFSYSDPNLQNIPKEEKGDLKVRRAFIPTSDSWYLFMIDYDQQEYRLLLDLAGETYVIKRINEEGLDVHEATAEMMGVTRSQAKTLNFKILYGGGVRSLAKDLGLTISEAEELRELYFSRLPNVRKFSRGVTRRAEERGFVFNWAGRVCHFPLVPDPTRPGKHTRFSYRAPNHIIQGGCADVTKKAMVQCHDFLEDFRSRLILNVHDELLFEVHKNELEIVPHLRNIMENAYPYRSLQLTCGVDHSTVAWSEKVAGIPGEGEKSAV